MRNSTGLGLARALHLLAVAAVVGGTAVAAAAAAAEICPPTVTGCGFQSCRAPAQAPPAALWSGLRPATTGSLPTLRDTTGFDRNGSYYPSRPFWQSLDVENGVLFTATNLGFQIWSTAFNPASPTRLFYIEAAEALPLGVPPGHDYFYVRYAEAPTGNPGVMTLTGWHGIGLSVWDTSGVPRVVYQDGGTQSDSKVGEQIYAAPIAGTEYAFLAASGYDAGLWVYDLDRALAVGATTACAEQRPLVVNPACNGVYAGKLSDAPVSHVAGTADGDRHYLAFSGGLVFDHGLEVWDVSDPGDPAATRRLISALPDEVVQGLAMWSWSDRLWLALAVRYPAEARIYDVTCLRQGPCALPAAPAYRFALPSLDASAQAVPTITQSWSGGRPFLYVGRRDGHTITGLQAEWLLDVSPLPGGPPLAVTGGDPALANLGQPTTVAGGIEVGYWGWYYACHPSGSNWLEPRQGKLWGNYFYRAGSSVLDVHRLLATAPPPPDPPPPTTGGEQIIFASGFERDGLAEWSAAVP